jgi:hypothetical protein
MRRPIEMALVLFALVGMPLCVGLVASSASPASPQRLATAPFVEATLIYVHSHVRSCQWRHGHENVRCTLTNGWTCTIEIQRQTATCITHTTVSSAPILGYGAPG